MDDVEANMVNDADFDAEMHDGDRKRENKKTGEMENYEAGENQPGDDDEFLFEEEEVKEGE